MTHEKKPLQRTSSASPTVELPWRGGVITGPDEESVRTVIAELEDGAERSARWPSSGREAMSKLVQSFPSLTHAAGVTPWDQDAFLRWLCSKGLSHGELHAGRFVLQVWNQTAPWEDIAREEGHPYPSHAAPFAFFDAVATWDRPHLAAFLAWVDAPFYP